MKRAYKLAIPALIVLAVAISLPTVAGGGGISVSYPPYTDSLKIPVGATENTKISLKNKSDENLLAIFGTEGLENVKATFPDNLALKKNSSETVIVGLNSDNIGAFSGSLHITFRTRSETSGTGGKVVYGFSVPFEGRILETVYHSLNVSVDPDNGGTVSVSPSRDKYPTGQEVTLTAEPAEGYRFGWWSGDLSTEDRQVTLTIDSDKQANAHFIEKRKTSENRENIGAGFGWILPPSQTRKGKSATILLGSYKSGQFFKSPSSTYTIGDLLGFSVKSDSPITVEVEAPKKTIRARNLRHENGVWYGTIDTSQFDTSGSYLLMAKSGGDVLASKSFTLRASGGGGMPWKYVIEGLLVVLIPLSLVSLGFKPSFTILLAGVVAVIAWVFLL